MENKNILQKMQSTKDILNERRRERRWQKDQELKETNFDEWERKRRERNEKKRIQRVEFKESNPEEWQEKREARNKRRRETRARMKETAPEEFAQKEGKRCETRAKTKDEILNEIQDRLYEKYKSTFPTKVSKSHWEKLKKEEFNFLHKNVPDYTIRDLEEVRRENLELLQENPSHHCAGSLIFFIKTLVHRPKDIRKLTNEELDFVSRFSLPPLEKDENKMERRRKYYEEKQEREKELSKMRREKREAHQKLSKLNRDFIAADPNKVLSISDIVNNPYMSNFSRREEFKVFLFRDLGRNEKEAYFEKWRKEREDYEKEVEALDENYKRDFLERMKDKCYFDEWEERKERYLNFHRK